MGDKIIFGSMTLFPVKEEHAPPQGTSNLTILLGKETDFDVFETEYFITQRADNDPRYWDLYASYSELYSYDPEETKHIGIFKLELELPPGPRSLPVISSNEKMRLLKEASTVCAEFIFSNIVIEKYPDAKEISLKSAKIRKGNIIHYEGTFWMNNRAQTFSADMTYAELIKMIES